VPQHTLLLDSSRYRAHHVAVRRSRATIFVWNA
jgi:hypothetical protein